MSDHVPSFYPALILCLGLSFSAASSGQTAAPGQSTSSTQLAPQDDRDVSWKLLAPNILNDQKRIWTFPARLGRRRNWIPAAAVLGTTAALVALDPTEGSYFHRTQSFHGFNKVFSSNASAIGTVVAPASLLLVGLGRNDKKMEGTALLAGEAVADTEILSAFLKGVTQRQRPENVPPGGNYSDTWFDNKGSVLSGSFPSGHAIAAFAVATVVARRYGNHRWIPYVAYGLATAVAASRVTSSAHFLSDTFIGAALGYSITRFTVLPR